MRDFPGGLFHPSDDKQEVAFRYAVEKINANRDILPKSRLSAQIEQIKPQDSFHASKRGECGGPRFSPSPQTDSKKIQVCLLRVLDIERGSKGFSIFNRILRDDCSSRSISPSNRRVFNTAHNGLI